MKLLLKPSRRGQKGFTLIELLIVVAILGILAAVIIPNAQGFMVAGRLNAANTEAANVKTAAVGYMAEHNGNWPVDTTVAGFDEYYTGALSAEYHFDQTVGEEGLIDGVRSPGGTTWGITSTGWPGIQWDSAPDKQQWIRTP